MTSPRTWWRLGFTAKADDVVTSAQSAARLLATQIGAGSPVLVIGTEALADEVRNVGLRPVRKFADDPVAVVQGHSPETGWADLAEAALAIRAGALWVAANVDRTLPSERGLLPGNGSMVAALRDGHRSTSRRWRASRSRRCCWTRWPAASFERPLVVGDRLDTDIAGANAAGLPSLLVLTGVSTAADMVHADAGRAAHLRRHGSALAARRSATACESGRIPRGRSRSVRMPQRCTATGEDAGDTADRRPRRRERGVGVEPGRPRVRRRRRRRHGAGGAGAVVAGACTAIG